MQKNFSSESGIFNPRIFAAFTLSCVGVLLAMVSFASTPSSGTLTDTSGPISYTAGPFFQPNQSPIGLGQLDRGPRCGTGFPCDQYTLHVQLPANYLTTHCFPAVKVTLSWADTGTGSSDYDLYIYNGTNPTIDGNHAADYQSASGANPEVATVAPLTADGNAHDYTIVIVPFQPTGETPTVTIELLPGPAPGSPACGTPGFGGANAAAPGVPRFQTFVAPANTSAEPGSGEFNIGFNPHTGRIMTMNSGPVWRVTPPERLAQAKPECCEALWEDVSPLTTNIGVDPILWTDQNSGRTFASNNTTGANLVYAYSDNDGDPGGLTPAGWTEAGLSTPNGGADHQTIGSGPYPTALSSLGSAANQGSAVYYCSQDIVGPAACYRSDTLGASFGAPVLAYNGQGTSSPGGTDCGGLHGHIHIAPDGTAWLPVNQCGGVQGGAFSTDGGVTWTEFKVPGAISQQQGADPSIAIDANNRIYYAYVNNEPVAAGNSPEGHARVAVGTRSGNAITWSGSFDIGATHSVRNAVHIEAIGGSGGRAGVGFFGTDAAGDYQALHFPGKWYAFIATTYDDGQSWTTVNATPNDAVQNQAGIWQQGGGATQRNLLDFNEITMDDKGRVLYGYSDGCVTEGCIAGTAPNDFTAFMRVARQIGGKTLLASYDANTDTTTANAPKRPCLSGMRNASGSHLTWKAPDNGGAAITQYQIFRGILSGAEGLTPIGYSASTKFDDTSALASVKDYFYTVKAVNSAGTGNASNEVDLIVAPAPPPPNPCVLGGVNILMDGANDIITPTGFQTNPGWDLRSLAVSEPYAFAPNKLVFTLKVQDLSVVPPNTRWPVQFVGPNGAAYFAMMSTWPTDGSVTGPVFLYGSTAGPFVAADPLSNYTLDGTITIVVPASGVGVTATGQSLTQFLVRVRLNAAVINPTPDNMPDSLAPTGSYTVVGNAACAPNTAPVASLSAYSDRKGVGSAPKGPAPLVIDFDGSASSDPDRGDTISSFTFNFGDGSQPLTQSSPRAQHTYSKAGQYTATLKVTDSRALRSNNTGRADITVTGQK